MASVATARAWGLLGALLLAGCTSGPDATGRQTRDVGVSIPPMTVTLTPREPWETPGEVDVTSSGTGFAVASALVREYPTQAIRIGDDLFVRQARAWTRIPRDDPQGVTLWVQNLAWDLHHVIATASFAGALPSEGDGEARGSGSMRVAGNDFPFTAAIQVEHGRVVGAVVAVTGGRESPYTFRPGPGVGFDIVAPTGARTSSEVTEGDREANDAHRAVATLVDAYQARRAGILPPEVTPEELRVELVASGASWPTNPYTGQPLGSGDASGEFAWRRCEPTVGHYIAWGWDGPIFDNRWGARACEAT